MVKFSKQFEGQLVPEWKEAFVDYWQLKKDLKRMHAFNANNEPGNMKPQPAFARRLVSELRKLPLFGPDRHKDHEAIQAWHCLYLPCFSLSFTMFFPSLPGCISASISTER